MDKMSFYDKKRNIRFTVYFTYGTYMYGEIIFFVGSIYEEDGPLIGHATLYDTPEDHQLHWCPDYEDHETRMIAIREVIKIVFTGKDTMQRYRENRDKYWAENRLNINGRKILFPKHTKRRGQSDRVKRR